MSQGLTLEPTAAGVGGRGLAPTPQTRRLQHESVPSMPFPEENRADGVRRASSDSGPSRRCGQSRSLFSSLLLTPSSCLRPQRAVSTESRPVSDLSVNGPGEPWCRHSEPRASRSSALRGSRGEIARGRKHQPGPDRVSFRSCLHPFRSGGGIERFHKEPFPQHQAQRLVILNDGFSLCAVFGGAPGTLFLLRAHSQLNPQVPVGERRCPPLCGMVWSSVG